MRKGFSIRAVTLNEVYPPSVWRVYPPGRQVKGLFSDESRCFARLLGG